MIDVLRGFALLGILVVNMAAFRAPPVFGEADAGALDRVATFLIAFGFEQKFYVLFSFLFGYGLSEQMARAAARGARFIPRFLRRLLGLFLIGLAHALLLFTGDILVTYALLGVVLLLMRNARDRVLLGVAAGLVALTALLFVLGGTAFAPGESERQLVKKVGVVTVDDHAPGSQLPENGGSNARSGHETSMEEFFNEEVRIAAVL